ncbi:formylglycine-generating enzyme family protein [Pararhodobacter sp.]|uniref:formylglycine-generating enzyme family protein n=1 Tax=Pararhodobacter sp. TaxID=2127056 RepID=UPI002FE35A2D
MTAAAIPAPPARRPASRFAAAGLATLAAVITLGAGLFLARPTPLPGPLMAPSAVILPDGQRLSVQRFEVTIAEWNRCHAEGACSLSVQAPAALDPATTPATGLNYLDAQEYLAWFNRRSGGGYRLPTLAEWQAMAAPVLPDAPDPIFTDPNLRWASAYLLENDAPRRLRAQGAFSTTPEGIADLDGSVWEWTSDCAQGPEVPPDRCAAFHLGGNHLATLSYLVRDPARGGCATGTPPAHLGLRLVREP